MTKKKPKKKYFPNNWEAIAGAPAELFESIPFEQFMDWKMSGWEIPSSIACIIREHNLKTGKITEYVYQRHHAAEKKCRDIMAEGDSEFLICDMDEIHHMEPKYLLEKDNENS
tara:strand:- start:1820 stop:2158 length:339 start_codon:yes stop_codon:yes gene_type:complete